LSPRIDLNESSGESVLPEYFEHPSEGYLQYDPNTLYINPNRDGQKPIRRPIVLAGTKFFGTKQPLLPTCSEPSEGNSGCQKWYGCPMKKYIHIGPNNLIIRKHGTVSMARCDDYYETTRGGRPTSQMHLGLDGWKIDTSRTTIDVLGRTEAITSGKLDVESSHQAVMASKPKVWQMPIGDLAPMWWPLVKEKGEQLHPAAAHYPELVEDDEPEPEPTPRKKRAASR